MTAVYTALVGPLLVMGSHGDHATSLVNGGKNRRGVTISASLRPDGMDLVPRR